MDVPSVPNLEGKAHLLLFFMELECNALCLFRSIKFNVHHKLSALLCNLSYYLSCCTSVVEVNRADFQGEAAPPKELGFEVKFAGIDTVLVQDDHDILHSGIEGY